MRAYIGDNRRQESLVGKVGANVKKTVADVREILKERDLRLTPQREAILRILLRGQDDHMTAEDIYDRTRDEAPDIGLATIYRTLDLFEELGLVSRLEFGAGGRRYEFSLDRDKHYHHHLLCLGCGNILEFNEDLLDTLEETIGKESGFQIVDHSLRFFGYCAKCQSKRREAKHE